MYENQANQALSPIGKLQRAEGRPVLDEDPDIQRAIELAYGSAEALQLLRAKRDRLDGVIADVEKRLANAAEVGPEPAGRL